MQPTRCFARPSLPTAQFLVVNFEDSHFRFRSFHSVRGMAWGRGMGAWARSPADRRHSGRGGACSWLLTHAQPKPPRLPAPRPCPARVQTVAVGPGVQADADAIVVLDERELGPATAAWPRTHAFPDAPKVGHRCCCSAGERRRWLEGSLRAPACCQPARPQLA